MTSAQPNVARGVDQDLDADAGASLVELVVVLTLTLVLGTMIVTTFLNGAKAVLASDARGAATQQAKVVTENLAKQLRLAVDPDGVGLGTAFVTATPAEVVFYSANGNRTGLLAADQPPKRVRIWLDGTGTVRQQVVEPVVVAGTTTWPGSGSTRVLAVDVVAAGLPLFTFLATGDVGTDAQGVAVTSLANTGGTVTGATALGAIQAVEVWVAVRTTTSNDPTTAVTRVTLLNR